MCQQCLPHLPPYWAVDGDCMGGRVGGGGGGGGGEGLTEDSAPIVGNLINSDCMVSMCKIPQ